MSEKQITKVIRLEIVKPVGEDWKTVGKMLHKMQKDTSKALNYCMRYYYVQTANRIEELEKAGEKPIKKNIGIIGKSLCSDLGMKYGDFFSSYVYGKLSNVARQKFQEDWWNILILGDKRLPYYRQDTPIYIAFPKQGGIKIEERIDNGNIDRILITKLLPKIKNRVPETSFILSNRSFRDNSIKTIWDRLIAIEYKLCEVKLIYSKRKKKWFANISYSFTPDKDKKLDPNIRVGVDLGLSVPAYLAVHGSFKRLHLKAEGESIEKFRMQVESRRKKLRHNEKKVYDRRSGRGRKHKIQPIEVLEERINNFRNTTNHRISKAVINFALENNAGTIVMEDLKGYYVQHSEDKYLKNWTYNDLQNKIKNKAGEQGIEIELVDPKYTSQRCYKCGHIAEENRPSRDAFKCVSCGFEAFADHNAALNIATPDIEKIINRSLPDKKNQADSPASG